MQIFFLVFLDISLKSNIYRSEHVHVTVLSNHKIILPCLKIIKKRYNNLVLRTWNQFLLHQNFSCYNISQFSFACRKHNLVEPGELGGLYPGQLLYSGHHTALCFILIDSHNAYGLYFFYLSTCLSGSHSVCVSICLSMGLSVWFYTRSQSTLF